MVENCTGLNDMMTSPKINKNGKKKKKKREQPTKIIHYFYSIQYYSKTTTKKKKKKRKKISPGLEFNAYQQYEHHFHGDSLSLR